MDSSAAGVWHDSLMSRASHMAGYVHGGGHGQAQRSVRRRRKNIDSSSKWNPLRRRRENYDAST